MDELTLAFILIGAGLVLLFAELLLPSGILLAIAVFGIIAGLAMTFKYSEDKRVGWVTLVFLVVVVPLMARTVFRLWARTPLGKRFFLTGPEQDATLASMPVNLELEQLRGRFGRALSDLRPSGVVDFEGRRVDSITEGMMVNIGQWVRCIDVRAGKVMVRPVDKPNLTDLENADFG
jgi:membrane-bound serine protease (ClpP class)